MTPDRQCWEAVAAVLTGQRLTAPDNPGWQAVDVVEWLAEEGWPANRLANRRAEFSKPGDLGPARFPTICPQAWSSLATERY